MPGDYCIVVQSNHNFFPCGVETAWVLCRVVTPCRHFSTGHHNTAWLCRAFFPATDFYVSRFTTLVTRRSDGFEIRVFALGFHLTHRLLCGLVRLYRFLYTLCARAKWIPRSSPFATSLRDGISSRRPPFFLLYIIFSYVGWEPRWKGFFTLISRWDRRSTREYITEREMKRE